MPRASGTWLLTPRDKLALLLQAGKGNQVTAPWGSAPSQHPKPHIQDATEWSIESWADGKDGIGKLPAAKSKQQEGQSIQHFWVLTDTEFLAQDRAHKSFI